jgi:type IV pilus assembly protein PilW
MNLHRTSSLHARRHARGVTLIELMIALVLGLLVVGAAIGIFVSNRQAFRATENLSRIQENARVGYELMAREVREAGGNPCSRSVPVVNVLNDSSAWSTNWSDGVRGYNGGQAFAPAAFGTAAGTRVAGTDAIELRAGASGDVTVTDHKPKSAQFKVSTVNHGLLDGDIVMVCDFVQASIFQITNAQNGINDTVVHNNGTGTPGNCSKGLGWANPPLCTTNGNAYAYGPNSIIARLRTTGWYIGNNGRNGGRSLYQTTGQGTTSTNQEIAEGVQDMRIQYLVPGATDYVEETAITNWGQVSAVRIVLTLQGSENVGVDGAPITRELAHVVTLRNRNS